MKVFQTNRRGMTLIEIIIVVLIIGLLAALIGVALRDSRLKSRDTTRLSHVKNIREALAIYSNRYTGYPTTVTFGGTLSTPGGEKIIDVPTDPRAADCSDLTVDGGGSYSGYTYTSDGSTYSIEYCIGGLVEEWEHVICTATPDEVCNTD